MYAILIVFICSSESSQIAFNLCVINYNFVGH